jgi:hypothetical protein
MASGTITIKRNRYKEHAPSQFLYLSPIIIHTFFRGIRPPLMGDHAIMDLHGLEQRINP